MIASNNCNWGGAILSHSIIGNPGQPPTKQIGFRRSWVGDAFTFWSEVLPLLVVYGFSCEYDSKCHWLRLGVVSTFGAIYNKV